MWAQQLQKVSCGPLGSLLYSSCPIAVSSRKLSRTSPAFGNPHRTWSKKLLSSVLAASLISGNWVFSPIAVGALVSFEGYRHSSLELSVEHQQVHFSNKGLKHSDAEAHFVARAINPEAATIMSVMSRLEGYLTAKGHNGQLNRLYFSIPNNQVATQTALFFVGDFVDGDGDALIERLNTGEGVAATLLPKLDAASNLFIVYPSFYTDGKWSCYTSMLPNISATGEPHAFDGKVPKAAEQLAALLDDALRQLSRLGQEGAETARDAVGETAARPGGSGETFETESVKFGGPGALGQRLPTFVMGFSKGGVVLNELLAEMAALEDRRLRVASNGNDPSWERRGDDEARREVGASDGGCVSGADAFLESISEVHYIDVGLICPGAYLTDPQKLSSVVRRGNRKPLTIGLHGTPRQWAEKRRPWIGEEKDRMLAVLQAEAAAHPGIFQVFQKHYLHGQKVGMRMHFEIVDRANFEQPTST